jgi:hypothetical protein
LLLLHALDLEVALESLLLLPLRLRGSRGFDATGFETRRLGLGFFDRGGALGGGGGGACGCAAACAGVGIESACAW